MINNFAMMMRIQGNIPIEQVQAALRKVRVRHLGLFQVKSAEQLPDDFLFPLSVRAATSDTNWIEIVQKELAEPFPDTVGPYGRFTLLQHPEGMDLVGTFHHGFSDGISGMYVMRDIAQALGEPDIALVPLPAPQRGSALIPKALLEDRIIQQKTSDKLLKLRRRVLRHNARQRALAEKPVETAPVLEAPADNADLEMQFVVLPTRLTVEQTSALMARCKKEQVSVHVAICIAWLRAFAVEPTEPQHIGTISSPVNLRERLSEPVGETTGPFLSIVKTHVDDVASRDFWEVAREFKQKFTADMRDEILFSRHLMMMQMHQKVPPGQHDAIRRMLFRGGVNYDFSITNLGRLVIPERVGPLYVDAFYGPLVNSSPMERTVGVSTLGGRMSITYIFRKSKMDPAIGQGLINRAVSILLEAAGEPC